MQNNQSLHFQSQYYQPLTPSTQDINSYVDEENLTFAVKMKRGLVENPTLCTEIDTINAPSATVDDDEIEEFDYKQDDSLFLPELIPLIQLKQSFENEDNLKFIMKMKKVLVEDPTSYTENDLHGITSTALDDEDIEEFDYKPDTFLFLQELNRSTHRHKNNHSRLNVFSPNQRGFIAGINGRSNNASIVSELYCDAIRKNKDIIITALDFKNAFGSVPHEMIFSSLIMKGFLKNSLILLKTFIQEPQLISSHQATLQKR